MDDTTMNDGASNFTGSKLMRRLKASMAFSLILCACLLAGCTTPSSSPAESLPGFASSSAAQNTVDSSAAKDPGPSAAPVTEEKSAPESSPSAGLTEKELNDVCQNGYLFFRQCQIGQEGMLDFDLEDQFFQEDQQYVAVASLDSRKEFLDLCRGYYTDTFIEQNILPWFEGTEQKFLEKGERLYYRLPSGTGLVSPLAIQEAVIEPQGTDTLLVTLPLWDSQRQICLDTTVKITLLKQDDAWKISGIQE